MKNEKFKSRWHALGMLSVALACSTVSAAEVKVGVLALFSGPYSWWGQQYQQGIDLALAEVNGTVAGHKITVLTRDEGGVNPQRVKQLAQELIVRDKVQYLAGGVLTPTVIAAAPVINEAKIPYVIMNSGTTAVTKMSPYFVRAGVTQWSLNVPLAKWAYAQGARKASIAVADFAPGQDALESFSKTFKELGGEIVSEVKIPLNTVDFSSYMQKLRDDKPKYVFTFMTLGPMSIGFTKAIKDAGLDKTGMKFLYTTELSDSDLPPLGDQANGLISSLHYGPYLSSKRNAEFVKGIKAKFGKDELPSMATLAAYDAMQLIFQMVRATNGVQDTDKAMASLKGFKLDSPRGPVVIDDKREMVQNIYIRRVEKMPDGKYGNKDIFTYPAVKEPWYEANP
ncbi:MAG: ABC transporter substrate-binding protein [Pseudomonas sp.]